MRRGLQSCDLSPAGTSAPRGNSSASGLAALQREAQQVLQADKGARNTTYSMAVFRIAGLVSGGELSLADAEAELKAAARSAGLADSEIDRTWQGAYAAGSKGPLR